MTEQRGRTMNEPKQRGRTMNEPDLFGHVGHVVEEKKSDTYSIMPVSVIDIAAQKKRQNENHGSTSSRANYSPFPAEVCKLCYEFFFRDKENIIDPFAGWGERGHYAKIYNKLYNGFDISEDAIIAAKSRYDVDNTLADSRKVDIPSFDGLITCPPYWNLEKYANESGIDRSKTWELFCNDLTAIFKRFYEAADDGAIFCIMVGDWRKNHVYYDLDYIVSHMFKVFGAQVIDKITISRKNVSKIKIMLPQAKRLGYTVRVHENLTVFKKTK